MIRGCTGSGFGVCLLCRKFFNRVDDPIGSQDMGGDCVRCMAEAGDPDALTLLNESKPRGTEAEQELKLMMLSKFRQRYGNGRPKRPVAKKTGALMTKATPLAGPNGPPQLVEK